MSAIFRAVKSSLYFPVARYFRWFAGIQLSRWQPKVIVVTGSNGKTSTFNLLKVDLGGLAHFSEHANSTYGICFDILGLQRTTFKKTEWLMLFILAPFRAFKAPYSQKVYVVEADCDRPGEGKFLSGLLRPAVTIWLSSDRTHAENFDQLVADKQFSSVEPAIAREFGYFVESATERVIINEDNPLIIDQLQRTTATVTKFSLSQISAYTVSRTGTTFVYQDKTYTFPYLLPKEFGYSLMSALNIAEQFGKVGLQDLSKFELPPSRSSLLEGIKHTTIIDSSYNANLASTKAILSMVKQLPDPNKWLIIGDLIEQGKGESADHLGLVEPIIAVTPAKIILVGPRLRRSTYPKLRDKFGANQVLSFIQPRNALDYIKAHLQGNELLVFKGARFLEGIIEHLLANPTDVNKLCRREPVWQNIRKRWGL